MVRSQTLNPRHVPRQFRDYARSLGWVLRDAGRKYWTWAIGITLLNLVGVLTGAASLGGIVLLARHAGDGGPIHFKDFTFAASTSGMNLVWFAAALALLGLFSGFCLYFTERLIVRVTAEYERFNSIRVANFAGDARYRGWTDLLERPVKTGMSRLIASGSRLTAYVVRDMLRVILPVLTFAFALGVLLWIDARITLLLSPLVAAYLVPLYLVNLRVAKTQAAYRAAAPKVRRAISRAMRLSPSPDVGNADDSSQQVGGATHRHILRLHYDRVLTPKRVQLINTIFAMVCVLTLMVYFAIDQRINGRSWADLLTYLIALRFAVSALRQVSTLFAKFSRYLPEYRSYSKVVEGAEKLAEQRRGKTEERLPDAITLRLGRQALWGSARRMTVKPGETLAVLVPDSGALEPFELEAIASRLERRMVEKFDFVGRAKIVTHRNGHGAAHAANAEDVVLISEDAVRHEPSRTGGVHRESYLIVVDQTFARSGEMVVLPQCASIVVMNDRKILGGGDLEWFRVHATEINQTLKSMARPAEEREDFDNDDDDLDE